jgi:hypothetical protein
MKPNTNPALQKEIEEKKDQDKNLIKEFEDFEKEINEDLSIFISSPSYAISKIKPTMICETTNGTLQVFTGKCQIKVTWIFNETPHPEFLWKTIYWETAPGWHSYVKVKPKESKSLPHLEVCCLNRIDNFFCFVEQVFVLLKKTGKGCNIVQIYIGIKSNIKTKCN